MKRITILLLGLCLVACTNAEMKQITSLGDKGEITCYSGGKEIYKNKSTGTILTEENSDGWYFEEEGTNQLIRISGTCIIRN